MILLYACLHHCRTTWDANNSAGLWTIQKRQLLEFGYELPNICSRNAIFGYALVSSWACVQSKRGNTPLTVMRNHYTKKVNLGNGHEYPFLACTVWLNTLSFGMISLLMNWSFRKTKNRKGVFDSHDSLMWMTKWDTLMLCFFWHVLAFPFGINLVTKR
jgi:hypothetical protein